MCSSDKERWQRAWRKVSEKIEAGQYTQADMDEIKLFAEATLRGLKRAEEEG